MMFAPEHKVAWASLLLTWSILRLLLCIAVSCDKNRTLALNLAPTRRILWSYVAASALLAVVVSASFPKGFELPSFGLTMSFTFVLVAVRTSRRLTRFRLVPTTTLSNACKMIKSGMLVRPWDNEQAEHLNEELSFFLLALPMLGLLDMLQPSFDEAFRVASLCLLAQPMLRLLRMVVSLCDYPSRAKNFVTTFHQVQTILLETRASAYYASHEYMTAIYLYSICLQSARNTGDRAAQGRACVSMGNAYKELKDFTSALSMYTQAMDASRECGDQRVEGEAIFGVGAVLSVQGEHEKAAANFELYLQIKRSAGDREGEARGYNWLAIAWLKLGKYEKAIEALEKQLTILREKEDRAAELVVCSVLGLAYEGMGEYAKAVEVHALRVERAKEMSDRRTEGRATVDLARLHWLRTESEKATALYHAGLEIARETQDRETERDALDGIATAKTSAGDHEAAIELREQFLEMALQAGDSALLSRATSRLRAALAQSVLQVEKAVERHEARLQHARETGDLRGQRRALVCLVSAHEAAGGELSNCRVIEMIEKVLEIELTLGELKRQEDAWEALGDRCVFGRSLSKAGDYYERGIAVCVRKGEWVGRARLLAKLQAVCRAAGASYHKKVIEVTERRLWIAREMQDAPAEEAALQGLAAEYEALGEHGRAEQMQAQLRQLAQRKGGQDPLHKALPNSSLAVAAPSAKSADDSAHTVDVGAVRQRITAAMEFGTQGQALQLSGQHAAATAAFEKSLQLAQGTGEKQRIFASCMGVASSQYNLCEYGKAVETTKQALQIAQEARDRTWEASAFTLQGQAFERLQDYARAVEAYEAAWKLSQGSMGEGMACACLAAALHAAGEHSRSIEMQERALRLAPQMGPGRLQWEIQRYWGLVAAYEARVELRKALEAFERMHRLAQQTGHATTQSRVAVAFAGAACDFGEIGKAIEVASGCECAAREQGDVATEQAARSILCRCYCSADQPERAVELLEQDLDATRSRADRAAEAATCARLGNAYRLAGRHALAIEMHTRCASMAREAGDCNSALAALGSLRLAYEAAGDYQQAIQTARKLCTAARESVRCLQEGKGPAAAAGGALEAGQRGEPGQAGQSGEAADREGFHRLRVRRCMRCAGVAIDSLAQPEARVDAGTDGAAVAQTSGAWCPAQMARQECRHCKAEGCISEEEWLVWREEAEYVARHLPAEHAATELLLLQCPACLSVNVPGKYGRLMQNRRGQMATPWGGEVEDDFTGWAGVTQHHGAACQQCPLTKLPVRLTAEDSAVMAFRPQACGTLSRRLSPHTAGQPTRRSSDLDSRSIAA